MPTLNWIGKEKVINHHRDVPFKILEHKYGFNETNGEVTNTVNSGNKIIHGDNLEALKSLLPEYEGKIKCIYIDPPYNTGNENWVYNDNVNHPKIRKWLEATLKAKESGKEAAIGIDDLARHDKWLCMMYPRLKLLQKLLADDGVIFISIDDNEQANLKLICDEIFGSMNFVAQFLWKKKGTSTNVTGALISPQTEYITCYCRKKFGIKQRVQSSSQRSYPFNDNEGIYRKTIIEKRNDGEYARESMVFEIIGLKPRKGKRWQIGLNTARELENKNRFINEKGVVKLKIYDFEDKDTTSAQPTLLLEYGTTEVGRRLLNSFGLEFSNPKPIELLTHLINISTNSNSYILDSFAGSGTTAHAVLNLNKQDGGNRKFILVEMENYANTITAERVKRVIKGYGDKEGIGGSFDYYELGKPLFVGENNEYLNEEVDTKKIREYIWYSETRNAFEQPETKSDTPYFLGKKEGTAYYFIYEKESLTTLDYDTLSTIKTRAEQYVIYADNCLLPKDFMMKKNIVFKKIPRDVPRF